MWYTYVQITAPRMMLMKMATSARRGVICTRARKGGVARGAGERGGGWGGAHFRGDTMGQPPLNRILGGVGTRGRGRKTFLGGGGGDIIQTRGSAACG